MGMRRVATVASEFQRLEVWRSPASCEFRVAGAVHAWWHRERFLTGLAWDNLAAASLLRPEGPPRSLLMLGLAGGTALRILRHLLPGCRFVAVDIDAEVVAAAREHMELDALGVEVALGDAYEWVAAGSERFDVVIDDCFLAGEEDVFRPQQSPQATLGLLAERVAPGGLLACNLVTGAGHRRLQSRTRAAFKRRFPEVRSVTTPDSMNETLVAGAMVLGGRALRDWEDRFAARKDRDLWRRIGVRGIQVPARRD